MNDNATVKQILHYVGGRKCSSVNALRCTRLRMEFNDHSRMNEAHIRNITGVISVVENGASFKSSAVMKYSRYSLC
ncbi:hypothetical protein Dd703_1435 [Musicola paradisiaca Ech703]|uniref:Uncharacterized protein n=1 Tax=Musicola paradisiaca (strain Ech703) TaxID=579405 RepID=C6C2X2_MUSP7|nr:hypothetical protein Dd703_1435 [Musicola paradisiaca Ech703]